MRKQKENVSKATPDKEAASPVRVNCTVLKNGSKIRNSICAAGKRISLPADEVKALVDLGVVSAG